MLTSHNGHGANILIVEDDANVLNVMRDYLSRANFKVRSASNGWEALKRFKEGPIDLVISEAHVADMDGCRLREKCLLRPDSRDVPFLVLVPEAETDQHVHALRSGVDDIVSKPFDPIVLVARVQAVIGRRLAYEEMVRVDPLTRLLNRPTLEKEVQSELLRNRRYGRSSSMVLLDLDRFEDVNRESGVSMGDLLLTCLGGIILTSIRVMDTAGRFHGEQFLLCLPETSLDGAEALTNRIRTQLSAVADAITAMSIKVSAGLLEAPEHGEDYETILGRLYTALHTAKAKGGNVLEIWSPEIEASVSQS